MSRGVHLVGGINAEDAESVFRLAAATLGERLTRITDGETGPARGQWIQCQRPFFMQHPQFEMVEEDPDRPGSFRQPRVASYGIYARTQSEMYRGRARLRQGVRPEDIVFENIGYADWGIESYELLQRLKADDVVPSDWRFQVSLPSPVIPLRGRMVFADQVDLVEPAYRDAFRREIERMVEAIPAAELAIQWDCTHPLELEAAESEDERVALLDYVAGLAALVPEPVELGYHLCYGDFEHRHQWDPTDLATCVTIANEIAAAIDRPLDWVHMPVPRDRDDLAFFEPLRDLAVPEETTIVLGLVHVTDGIEGTSRRLATAARVRPDFAIATECGMGRRHRDTIEPLLRIHAKAADLSRGMNEFSLYETTVDDAYATYERFRRECPAAHSASFSPHWILTRYEDVRRAAKDWETYTSSKGVDLPKNEYRETAITTDPPLHDEYRALMQEVLNQKTINALQPYVVELVHRLVDEFAASGRCDLVAQFNEQLPPAVICRIVGLDEELAFEMRDVSMRLGTSWDDQERFDAAMAEFRAFVLPQIEARRVAPRGDYLTRLATEPFRGRPLGDESIVMMMIGFLLAGHESTTAGMSSLLYHVLAERGRAEAVLADERLLFSMVEETLRLNTPFHQFRRVTTCPVEVDGTVIPEGADVMLNFAAANRDPEAFERPDEFLPERRPNPHLGFGFGVHTCVGAPLARMELRVAVPELLRRLPDLRLDDVDVQWRFLGGNVAVIPELRATFSPEGSG